MFINKTVLVAVLFAAIIAIALSVGITYARADDNSSSTCTHWEYYPEIAPSGRYDGFLLCLAFDYSSAR